MSKPKKKRKNLLHIDDPKLNKAFWWVASLGVAVCLITILILIATEIGYEISEPGLDPESLLHVNSFAKKLLVTAILLLIALIAINIYVFCTNWEKLREEKRLAEAESPLTEAAKSHEQQIIDLMISIIKPVPGKKNISHAKTAKFIKALKDLNLMDVNLEGEHLIPWIETVTDFSAGKTSPFNQALDAVKVDDKDVPKYKEQLEQILAS